MLPRLHLVTDDGILAAPGFVERARRILSGPGEAVALHVRAHGLHGGALFAIAHELAEAARGTGTRLLVNDRVDVALAARSDGVQLGRRSIPVRRARALLGDDAWIGYSAHDPAEAADAAGHGADFVLLGAIFPTASHPGGRAAGPDLVRRTAGRTDAPVVAIGGITPERVADVLAAGAYGAAVLGGVWRAADPVAAAAEYRAALAGAR